MGDGGRGSKGLVSMALFYIAGGVLVHHSNGHAFN